MQFLKRDKKSEVEIFSLFSKNKKRSVNWILKITIISFGLSLFLSIFSEIFLSNSNFFLAFILLVVFMFVNIMSDMLGLAIISCPIEDLKKYESNKKLFNMCLRLKNNSDKVSSILCDVIGDACGILCGVSGSILSIILSKKIFLNMFGNLIAGAIISSIIVGLTVLFKAISKKFAVENAVKIVLKIGKFLVKFNRKS